MAKIKQLIEKNISQINAVDENTLYSITDYPVGGITQEQMINALSLQQEGFYQINSVYMCIDDGDNYIKNHCYKFIPFEDSCQWEDITPWNEAVDTTLESLKNIDDKKLYSITDYPIGGITNSQMNDALTDVQEGFYQVGSVYMCTDEGTYLKNHFYKFNDLSWEDVTPEFAGELKDVTLEELESEVIDEDTLYNIKDYPIGGISSLQMVNALKPEQLGFYQVGSVYLCTDDYSDYIKHHFYRFDYNEETDTYSWVDTKAGADIDKELSLESENPVANNVVTEALNEKVSKDGNENVYGIKSFDVRPRLGVSDEIVIPSEYQRVEYIESTGTQYINTNFYSNKCRAVYKVEFIESGGHVSAIWASNYDLVYMPSGNPLGFNISGYNGIGLNYNTSTNTPYEIDATIYSGKQQISVDNEKIYENTLSFSQTDRKYYIFCGNENNSTTWAYSKIKLYYIKYYDDENLERNMIPCYRKSDGVIGLYDLVYNKFYPNNGTGVFLKGEDIANGIDFATIDDVTALQPDIDSKVSLDKDEVIKGQKIFTERPQIGEARLPTEFTEVEYIESTGTQYIDTLVKPSDSNYFKMDFKVEYTSLTSAYLYSAGFDVPWFSYERFREGNSYWNIGSSVILGQHYISTNTIYEYNVIYNNGVINSTNAFPFSGNYSGVLGSRTLEFFGCSDVNTYQKIKLYTLKLYSGENFTLVRDFIPCYRKSDNKTGLYDVVNNQFYTNQGTGEFLKGNDILSGEYLALQSEIPEIIANPKEEATEELTKISIDNIIFSLAASGSGGSSVIFREWTEEEDVI